MPQGTMAWKWPRSGATLKARPWLVIQRARWTPTAPILRGPTQAPRCSGWRPASTPQSAQVRIIASSSAAT